MGWRCKPEDPLGVDRFSLPLPIARGVGLKRVGGYAKLGGKPIRSLTLNAYYPASITILTRGWVGWWTGLRPSIYEAGGNSSMQTALRRGDAEGESPGSGTERKPAL